MASKNLIEIYKDISQKVSENYLKNKVDPSISIKTFVDSGQIENEEILARVCEETNKKIYLSIFNSGSDKGSIKFPMAKKEEFNHCFKEGNPVYNQTPKDYKSVFSKKLASVGETEYDRMDSINDLVFLRNKIGHFVGQIQTMCQRESNIQDECINKIEKIANSLVMRGDSITDYAILSGKVAEHITGLKPGVVQEKIAEIAQSFTDRGVKINTDITKVASETPKVLSEIFEPVTEYLCSLAKTAGLSDIGLNALERMEMFDSVLENEKLK